MLYLLNMKHNISIIKTASLAEGTKKALNLILENNKQSVIWLSGGSSPRPLYEKLSKEENFKPAAAALIDERFGEPGHKDSNEKMVRETGLIDALAKNNISFFAPLDSKFLILDSLEQTAKNYEQVVKDLIDDHSQHIMIMGLGPDGHTAGLFPEISPTNKYVIGYKTKLNEFHERITVTPKTIKTLAYKGAILVILAFGDNKKEAIAKMLHHNSQSAEAAGATYHHLINCGCQIHLITDQEVS